MSDSEDEDITTIIEKNNKKLGIQMFTGKFFDNFYPNNTKRQLIGQGTYGKAYKFKIPNGTYRVIKEVE